jgi:hypothetical protein
MRMRGQVGFFDIDERLRELSAKGDELERLNSLVDFELFRNDLERAVPSCPRCPRSGRIGPFGRLALVAPNPGAEFLADSVLEESLERTKSA